MSRKRSRENMEKFRDLFLQGAAVRGVPPETALGVFEKVVAFSEFGFPKSHAAAFAVLAYQSMWLLHYHPAELIASIINAQPMGFYSPDTLIKDVGRRGVRFLRPDLNRSALGCTVQGREVRLGLQFVAHVGENKARLLLAERDQRGPFLSLPDLLRRTGQNRRVAESLVLAGALDDFGLNRRELLWQLGLAPGGATAGAAPSPEEAGRFVIQPALDLPTEQDQVQLVAASRWEAMAREYHTLGLSVDEHPIRLLRPLLRPEVIPIAKLRQTPNGRRVRIAGMVTTRQRPMTAKGILFLLLEDEGGMVNVVVRRELYEAHRELYRTEPLLVIEGLLERGTQRINLVAETAAPLRDLLPDVVKDGPARRVHQALAEWKPPPSHNYR